MQRFHVAEILTFSQDPRMAKLIFLDHDKQMSMLESALTLLCQVATFRYYTGLSEIVYMLHHLFIRFFLC